MKVEEKLRNYFETKKIGHAYLIYNIEYKEIEEQLKQIIKEKIFLKDLLLKNDIYVVKPENDKINKEQIKALESNFITKSQNNNAKVYIIEGADKMNISASNTLLKFLEEPEEDIYSFIITNNIDNILDTIKSRCIKLFLQNKKSNLLSIDEKDKEFLNLLNNKHEEDNLNIVYNKLKNSTKEEIKNLLEKLIILLRDALESAINKEEIIRRITFLNDIKKRLDYNVNINMFVDKIIVNW